MEELLAYAYCQFNGFDFREKYKEKLHELFLADLTYNENLLELEGLCGNMKESALYIRNHINYSPLDIDKFGRELMKLLKPIYQSMDIERFGQCMYSLWESLPGCLQDREPFVILNYADDYLSWTDGRETRKLYEKALSYFD